MELAAQEVAAPGGARGIACFPPAIPQNPYQRLLYESLAELGLPLEPRPRLAVWWLLRGRRRVAAVHMHWPQSYYRHGNSLAWARLALFALRLGAARMLRYRVLWTVHQVYPHEQGSARLDRCAARALAAAAQALIVHDEGTAARVRAELPRAGRKLVLIPHGSFIGVYPPGRSRAEVRAELGIPPDSFVFIAFGHVRGYKDVDVLLDGFAHAELDDAALVIAGMPIDPAGTALIEARAAADPRIRTVLRFVADDKVAELFEAADAAVISRGDGGTSGALILSLSLGAPAVVATSPTYVELIGDGDAGWTFTAGSAVSLARALELAASDRVAARAKSLAALLGAAQLSWAEAARRTAALVDKGPA